MASPGLPMLLLTLFWGRSNLAGVSEKWHSDSLRRRMQMLHGRLPSHLSFLRLQLSQAWAIRRLLSGATIGRGMMICLSRKLHT